MIAIEDLLSEKRWQGLYPDLHIINMTDFLNRRKDDLGETLLHYYATSNNERFDEKVCNILITYGADINCIDMSARTPLHRAVVAHKFGVTELLLNHGAFVNAQDEYKNTPLHEASTIDFQLCELLLKYGADPNIQNGFDKTPILCAVQRVKDGFPHCKQIIELLLKYGSSVVIRDKRKDNAIEVASRFGIKDVFNWCKQNVQNSTGKKLVLVNFVHFSFIKDAKFYSRGNLNLGCEI